MYILCIQEVWNVVDTWHNVHDWSEWRRIGAWSYSAIAFTTLEVEGMLCDYYKVSFFLSIYTVCIYTCRSHSADLKTENTIAWTHMIMPEVKTKPRVSGIRTLWLNSHPSKYSSMCCPASLSFKLKFPHYIHLHVHAFPSCSFHPQLMIVSV